MYRFIAAFCLCLGISLPLLQAAQNEDFKAWVKVKGKVESLRLDYPLQIPDRLLGSPARTIAFPAGGLPIDLPLSVNLPSGKPLKTAILPSRMLWLDVNGNGEKDNRETFRPAAYGYGPLEVTLKHSDGTEAEYRFFLLNTKTAGTYRLARGELVRHVIAYKRTQVTVLLVDGNNNGRYDDKDTDLLLVDRRPGVPLSKTITMGRDAGDVFDVVVYPSGRTIELKLHEGPTGVLDVLAGFQAPQQGVQVEFLVTRGALANPAFSQFHPRMRVPAGPYTFVNAVLARHRERVRVEKGGLPEISVEKDKTLAYAWGGEIEMAYDSSQKGDQLVFDRFRFTGKTRKEEYVPLAPVQWSLKGVVEEILVRDPKIMKNPLRVPIQAVRVMLGAGDVTAGKDGNLEPLKIKHHRKNMIIEVRFRLSSGIFGVVDTFDKYEFSYDPKK